MSFEKERIACLKGGLENKIAKRAKHHDVETEAMCRMVERHCSDNRPIEELSYFERMQTAYAIVRFTALYSSQTCRQKYDTILFFSDVVNELLRGMPADEFMRWFPPKKVYDGARYSCKDYFSTMSFVEAYPVITAPDEFLAEYYNDTIHLYKVNTLIAIDGYFEAKGEETPMEQFCRENGIRTYKMQGLSKGKILVTGSDGSQQIVRKTMPRHLRVIKGGMHNES